MTTTAVSHAQRSASLIHAGIGPIIRGQFERPPMSKKIQRTEESVTFALRHRVSGKIVRLEVESNYDRDDCGAETCRLSLTTDGPTFEVETLRDIAVVMQRDERWYNSSRTRPMWNGLDFKLLDVVSIHRSKTFDGPLGSDPIEQRQTIQVHPFPGFVGGTRLKSRRLPSPLVRRYFDAELSRDEMAWSEAVLVAFDQRPDPAAIVGQFLAPRVSFDNTGIVEAIVDMPEDYPIDGQAVDHLKAGGHLMIALVNLGPERFDLRPTIEATSFRP